MNHKARTLTKGARACAQRSARAPLGAILAALLVPGAGAAADDAARRFQAERDAGVCAEGTGIPDLDIVTCTRAIRLGGHSPLTRSALHNARGRAYRISGRLEPARSDHTAALAANPLSAEAHLGRALAVLALGERVGVAGDLERAVSLSPYFADAWRALGRLRFLAGDDAGAAAALTRALGIDDGDGEAHAFRGFVRMRQLRFSAAARDFRRAAELDLGYAYTALWEHLARRRAGEPTGTVLEAAARRLLEDEWPRPLIEVYVGQRAPEDALAHARRPGGAGAATREHEAAFFLGQLALLAGRAEEAREHLDFVRAHARANSVERAMLPR